MFGKCDPGDAIFHTLKPDGSCGFSGGDGRIRTGQENKRKPLYYISRSAFLFVFLCVRGKHADGLTPCEDGLTTIFHFSIMKSNDEQEDTNMGDKKLEVKEQELEKVAGGSGEKPMYIFTCNACSLRTTDGVEITKCKFCGSSDGTLTVTYFK